MYNVLTGLLIQLCSSKVLGKLLLVLIRELSLRTENTIDDELVKTLEEAFVKPVGDV